jgi:putative endonuclease
MYYVYVIKSHRDNKLYTGFTNNIERRTKEHHNGLVRATRFRRPFNLVYYEAYSSEKDARHRELNLKLRSRAFAQLKKRIQESIST